MKIWCIIVLLSLSNLSSIVWMTVIMHRDLAADIKTTKQQKQEEKKIKFVL